MIFFHYTCQQNYLHLKICTICGFFCRYAFLNYDFIFSQKRLFFPWLNSFGHICLCHIPIIAPLSCNANKYCNKVVFKKRMFACLCPFPTVTLLGEMVLFHANSWQRICNIFDDSGCGFHESRTL